MNKFIVAELTVNWNEQKPDNKLIGKQFEEVININDNRGYKLTEWKKDSVINEDTMTETIIAIFELKQSE